MALAQRHKLVLHPIAYYLVTFTPMEHNYNVYDRELLAIMKALAHWRQYLGWTKVPFTIMMDYANLQHWKSPQNLIWHVAWWHMDLQEYDYGIQYIPRKENALPDALSRQPGADKGQDDNQGIVVIPLEKFKISAMGYITKEGKVHILLLNKVKRGIMYLVHDHPSAGHLGQDETLRKTQERYYWPGMKEWITEYVKWCTTCQQNKILMHHKAAPIYWILTTENTWPFQRVAMDLIMGLPSVKGKDVILTIVDQGCLQAATFLPCNKTITGLGITQLYHNHIFWWFGLLTKIISDRDPRFMSQFGKALMARLGIKQNLSTAFHPQMDGLLEWKNQWIEQYLRLVSSTAPKD
jgi:hypothetical protein